MQMRSFKPLALLSIFILGVSLACSLFTSESTPAPTPIAQPNATPEWTQAAKPTAPAAGAINSREDVEKAVVRIEAKGDYVYPSDTSAGDLYDVIGSGSGFVIDPSGLVVTNNHVVTGANSLEVYFSGENTPHNARVLGVSECSDLAVIEIDGGPFPYLKWYDDTIKVGMQVWSAGYPLGDPEYSLHRGVISKRQANVPSDWAAVDAVLEHDATINPGNSGGPLIDDNGAVVGINYASSNQAVNEYYAIARKEADPILSELEAGKNVTSLGINGTAFVTDDGSSSGIWVYSVETGSPAYNVGIRGGDILTQLEGSAIGTDGTKKDYCQILRSHKPTDALSVQVVRLSTGEVLEGTLNGEKLAVTGNFDTSGQTNTDNSGNTASGGNTNNSSGSGNEYTTHLASTPSAVSDDFSENHHNFEVFEDGQAQVANGVFYLGKFVDCTDLNVNANNPFGCFSLCLTCGMARNYTMQVDATYVDGVSGRTFGIVLRFVDQNQNGLVDPEDYYLDFEYSAFDGYYYVWEHNTDGKWYIIDQAYGGKAIIMWSNVNRLKAVASENGTHIDIYANGTGVTSIKNIPYSDGAVGLVIGGRALQAAFDNFQFVPTD